MRNDIIQKVRKVVGRTAKKAAKVSGDTIDFTKLKFKLYDVKDQLDEKYAQIGRLVYDGSDSDEIDAICDAISELRGQEEEIKEKLATYKNKKTCPSCGASVDASSDYCQSCGSKF